MEGGINAEHHPVGPHGFIGVFNLAAHGHTRYFKKEVVVLLRHVDAALDIHAVAVPHVYHHRGHIGMAFGKQTYLPGQGKRRMPAVDEHGHTVRPGNVHDGVDHGGIGGEGIEKRLHLHAGKMLVAQIMFEHVVRRLSQVRIDPAEGQDAFGHGAPCRVHFLVEVRARRAEYGFFYVVLVHLTGEKLRIEIHVEGASEGTDMGMGVDFSERREIMPGIFHGHAPFGPKNGRIAKRKKDRPLRSHKRETIPSFFKKASFFRVLNSDKT